jgi:hypothetical protein
MERFERSFHREYKRVILKQEFVGANKVPPLGKEKVSWYSNFFYGNDSAKWCTNVPNYLEVNYENLYEGIDLRYYSSEKGLKYDFIVHPGANIEDIRVKYEGADRIYIDHYGNLNIKTKLRDIVDGDLFIYQDVDNIRSQIEGKFIKFDNLEYGFEILSDYYSDELIVIDPFLNLSYSTYLGGKMSDQGLSITIDQFGNAFVTGFTMSSDFPTTPGANDTTYNGGVWGGDAFILKLDYNGSKLKYSTFIGGNETDGGCGITVDLDGNAYVTGVTNSTNFPTTPNAYNRTLNHTIEYWPDVFVLKLNNSGSKLIFSTYLGGTDADWVYAITIDEFGNAYITGHTFSSNFPVTPGVYDPTYNGNLDLFITKLNRSGSTLDYSTFIGGTDADSGLDIILDDNNNAFITGDSYSTDFPTTPGANDTSNNGQCDVIVVKLNSSGTGLLFSTYIGGNDWDFGGAITIDSIGNSYVTGSIKSTNFPTTPDALDKTYNGGFYDSCFFKLNQNGSSLMYSTYIGGDNREMGSGISLDSFGNILIAGSTNSTDFPITEDAFDKICEGYDVYLTKLASNGTKIIYSTFIGGQGNDWGNDLVMDIVGNCYITGKTDSNDFQTTKDAYNRSLSGESDAFVVKFFGNPIFNISSLSLFMNNTPTNLIYSRLCPYTFRAIILDTYEISDLSIVYLTLDPQGSNLQLLWDRSTGHFTEVFDPNNYISISPTCDAKFQIFYWIIDFDIIFNWTYPDEDLNDVQTYATGKTLPSVWFNATNLYHVENDLVFNGTLSVSGEDNRTIYENELVRGGERFNWSGLKVSYENTIDVYPPADDIDVNIWNEAGNSWSDSPASGENFTTQTVSASATDTDGDTHVINITGIPPECDATNETFTIRIDGDNVTFTNPIPDYGKWRTTSDVEVGINITDIGGGIVNGSSVKYCFSTDNGTNWSEWIDFPKLKSGVSVNPQDVLIFPDGINNLVKWQAEDSVGNGPVESEEYRILVDTEDLLFSNGYPTEKNESLTENVEAGITISDVTSGVDASTVEYAISINSGISWTSWKGVTGLNSGNSINVTLSLKFPNGTANRIKWRASDVAGNGPTESEVFIISVNTWVAKVKIPEVKLWNPPNGSVIASTELELSWRLLNKDLLNVIYDVYLDTVNPPVKFNLSGIINTTLIIDNLSNGLTYYWTVIPKTEKINGSCESGVWSFTITIPIPKVNLISPENNSIINDSQPGLSWSIEYDGTEILTYDVYFGTYKDPELEFRNHPSTNCFIKERLTDGLTYYWKVVPWVGDYPGLVSETWSFTVSQEYIPHFELELFILPPVIELPPGDIRQVKAIVSNLGELEDSVLLRIEVTPDSGVGTNVNEPSIISVIPHDIAEFNIMVTTSLDAPNQDVILTVVASSRRASEYDLIVEERAELTVKIKDKEKTDEDDPWLSLGNFWIIFLIIIIILFVLIVVWIFLKQEKTSQETKDKSTKEDALTVKPGTVPEAEISVGKAPPTTTSPQLPETTTNVVSQQQTQTIAKAPTLASSTTPGQVPETPQIPQVTQVLQLPPLKPESSKDDHSKSGDNTKTT